jgi:serine/threonine protein phosphatase PrpC
MLSAEEAEHHPSRHTLREAVMGEPLTLIDKGSRRLSPDARLLVCSDGVNSLNDEQLLAQASLPADRIVAAVLATAKEHQDNITVVKLERAR